MRVDHDLQAERLVNDKAENLRFILQHLSSYTWTSDE